MWFRLRLHDEVLEGRIMEVVAELDLMYLCACVTLVFRADRSALHIHNCGWL